MIGFGFGRLPRLVARARSTVTSDFPIERRLRGFPGQRVNDARATTLQGLKIPLDRKLEAAVVGPVAQKRARRVVAVRFPSGLKIWIRMTNRSAHR